MQSRQQKMASRLFYSLLLMLLTTVPVAAEEEKLAEPQRVIDTISAQLADILNQDRERLKQDPGYAYQLADRVLVPHVDFDRVARLVLGKHWRHANSEQQLAFEQQFQRLLVRTYSTAFSELGSEWDIQYLPLRSNKAGNEVLVHTKVIYAGGPPLDVLYRMHLKDGSWMAYDVKIEGISLVTNYRSNFARELRKSGIDGLIKKMAELNDRREKKKATS